MNRNPGFLFGTALLVIIGGGIMIPVALVIWLLPSAVIFVVTLKLAMRRHPLPCGGSMGRNNDDGDHGGAGDMVSCAGCRGAGALMLIIAPASALSAPWIARKIYR